MSTFKNKMPDDKFIRGKLFSEQIYCKDENPFEYFIPNKLSFKIQMNECPNFRDMSKYPIAPPNVCGKDYCYNRSFFRRLIKYNFSEREIFIESEIQLRKNKLVFLTELKNALYDTQNSFERHIVEHYSEIIEKQRKKLTNDQNLNNNYKVNNEENDFEEHLSFKIMNEPKKVFISYSKKDVNAVEEKLLRDLRSLVRQQKIDIFYDKKLLVGTDWDTEIKTQLQQADIIILIVSPDFIATDYILDVEINKAIERHDKNEAKVIPIILRPCDWTGEATPISKLNAIPSKGKAITTFDNQDEAWLEVLQQIKKVIG